MTKAHGDLAPLRVEILREAIELTWGQRNMQYGEPSENFRRHAELLKPVYGRDITPLQAAESMIAAKMSRLMHDVEHRDSWVDRVAYTAIAAELALGRPVF